MIAWTAQKAADRWLGPGDVVQITGLSGEDVLSAMRKFSELMMLTRTFRKEETDFFVIE